MAKRKGKRKPRRIFPGAAPRKPNQFITIHNSALANKVRDTNIAESIKVRMKEDNTLTEIQIADLMKRRAELLKN